MMTTNGNVIAHYRVSTRKQERSGLGLEGQQAAVAEFAARQGAPVLTEYTEVETGKSADRPELAKAIAQAKRARATLVVAKLDRLARNVAFTSALNTRWAKGGAVFSTRRYSESDVLLAWLLCQTMPLLVHDQPAIT